jgi:hypothetical protein
MEPPNEPARSGPRLPLVVAGMIAVLAGLAFAFAWPW